METPIFTNTIFSEKIGVHAQYIVLLSESKYISYIVDKKDRKGGEPL